MRELCVPEDAVEVADVGPPASTAPSPQRGLGARGGGFSISRLVADKIKSGVFFSSVELIPGTAPHLRAPLEESLQHLVRDRPAFASVTWHVEHLALGEDGRAEHPALGLSARLQDALGVPALMHLAAGRMRKEQVLSMLESCLEAGVSNILALRGDYEVGANADFPHACDLVHFIRKKFGSQFGIGVAGYPLGHPDTKSPEVNLAHLKEKVDAGADFILTQMVSSAEEFHLFRQECDNVGIKIPIIPGIFLIQSYKKFEKLIQICNIKASETILNTLKELQNEDKEKEYGECLFRKLVKDLMELSSCPGAHIFSMNRYVN